LALKISAFVADIVFRLTKLNLKKPAHIAVIAPSAPCELFDLLWKGVWSAAFELAPFGVRVDRFETSTHDPTAQKRILANLRAKPPAALVIAPANISDLDQEIAMMANLKVPVITFHTDAPASRRETYVGTDPAQSGALAGEILGRLMGGRGTIASFPGPLETDHLRQRYLAFRKELKSNFPDIGEAVSHSGYSGMAEAAERVLEQNPPVGGIYVGCARSYEVAAVVARLGRKIPFVGFDMTESSQAFLADGTVSALIDEDVYHQGYLAVHQAYEATQPGETMERIPLQASVMLRANCNSSEGTGGLENLIRLRTRRAHRYQELLDQASSQIETLSEMDALTGLLNRSKFEELLGQRVKDQEKLSILMVGLDGFERGERSAGQPIGDEAVKTVAKVLREASRPEDKCARIASDEFCVLMPGADFRHVAAARERILAALAKTVIAPRILNLGIRVSAGAACLPADASNAEDLLVHADNAMYAHKRAIAAGLAAAREARMPVSGGPGDLLQIRPARLPI
jgi:diguanylate cyclase (GGDEF)-like protein